jgi:hypothetical protein
MIGVDEPASNAALAEGAEQLWTASLQSYLRQAPAGLACVHELLNTASPCVDREILSGTTDAQSRPVPAARAWTTVRRIPSQEPRLTGHDRPGDNSHGRIPLRREMRRLATVRERADRLT